MLCDRGRRRTRGEKERKNLNLNLHFFFILQRLQIREDVSFLLAVNINKEL